MSKNRIGLRNKQQAQVSKVCKQSTVPSVSNGDITPESCSIVSLNVVIFDLADLCDEPYNV